LKLKKVELGVLQFFIKTFFLNYPQHDLSNWNNLMSQIQIERFIERNVAKPRRHKERYFFSVLAP